MSSNRMIALGVVAVIHVVIGYALITGLALKVMKTIVAPIEAVQVKEEAPPPDEPPPPPPKEQEIPPFVPPPQVTVQTDSPPPTITTQARVETPAPVFVPAPPAPVAAPPAPPAPTGPSQRAQPANQRIFEVSEDDYPPSSKRAEEEGTTRIKVTIGANGRVTTCEVVTSSTHPALDERSCKIAQSRWRFKPALKDGQPVEDTYSRSVKWQLVTAK